MKPTNDLEYYYDKYKNDDNFLYIKCSLVDAFGFIEWEFI